MNTNPQKVVFGRQRHSPTSGVAITPDGTECFTGGRDGGLHQYALDLFDAPPEAMRYTIASDHLSLSPAGERLAIVEHDGEAIHVLERRTGILLNTITAWSTPFSSRGHAFSADGLLLATGTVDGVVAFHRPSGDPLRHERRLLDRIPAPASDRGADREPYPIPRTRASVHGLAFSRDDAYFAGAFGRGGARCWRTEQHSSPEALALEDTDGARAVAFHPQEPWVLAVGRDDGMIPVYHAGTGQHLRTLGSHATFAQHIHTLSFTPDGSLLLVGTDTALIANEFPSGVCRWCVTHLTTPVNALACSRDARVVVVNASDRWPPWHGHGSCTFFDFKRPNMGRG
jgi:WD40 repeat protein